MFLFLTPLKARAVTHDWPALCALTERALHSLFAQSDERFVVLLICHDRPDFSHRFDERLQFVDVDFEPPDPRHFDSVAGNLDKWQKLHHGLMRSPGYAPDYVMVRDADDFVSRRLVAHALQTRDPNGYSLRTGYVRFDRSQWLLYHPEFWQLCGSTAVLNAARLHFPVSLAAEQREACLFMTHGHTILREGMAERGWPLSDVPFPGAVYTVSHGDNVSGALKRPLAKLWRRSEFRAGLRELTRLRPLTSTLRTEFTLARGPAA